MRLGVSSQSLNTPPFKSLWLVRFIHVLTEAKVAFISSQ